MTSYYSEAELKKIGLCTYGKEVYISKKASIYSANLIEIGNYVRIDDFCILSGKIQIGSYVHIAAYTALYGGDEGIQCEDFVTLSSRNAVYAMTDDYYGGGVSNPLIDKQYRSVFKGKVLLKKHVLIGSACTILPNLVIEEGASVGAMSLVKRNLDGWTVYAGCPLRKIGKRNKKLLKIEEAVRKQYD